MGDKAKANMLMFAGMVFWLVTSFVQLFGRLHQGFSISFLGVGLLAMGFARMYEAADTEAQVRSVCSTALSTCVAATGWQTDVLLIHVILAVLAAVSGYLLRPELLPEALESERLDAVYEQIPRKK